ncbi:helix-turn-helix domain-containing protein [Muricomes sp. OA1]|uniref:helix-turn-helix domain-containing protein n=1 Tax=Muricomes sp. OA1 TaxID=2914165 RepID=UPI00046EBE09|nr:helix-turn-helix transcriptional regulator [Muricomes sp. OA1]MCH1971658.1 helix-turn-helix domain-containing protein [Muricomes sp. OA1]
MKPSKLLRLGGVLRFYRGKTGKTQSEFAELCNINVVQYRRYENNQSIPRQEQLEKIFSTLNKLGIVNQIGEPVTVDNFKDYDFTDTPQPTRTPEEQAIWLERMKRAYDKSSALSSINDSLNKLNNDGKKEAAKRVDELTKIPEYQKDKE